MSEQNRVIIGQSEQAGLPISAPTYTDDQKGNLGAVPMRWRQVGETFVLECYVFLTGWKEVPLWIDAPDSK